MLIQANMWSNPAEVCGNGRDDDGNGFADDGCEGGWSWALDSSTMSDPVGHGTHIAGAWCFALLACLPLPHLLTRTHPF